MQIPTSIICLIFFLLVIGYKERPLETDSRMLAAGQMPSITSDKSGNVHLVWGNGDSILYVSSVNQGVTLSKPALVNVLPSLAAASSRGPQIAITSSGITITACDKTGNIFSYLKDASGKWSDGTKVNDVDTTAKEGLMGLGGDGNNLFAIWLDLRDKYNKIFGSSSSDGGKTWSKNIKIYSSPNKTVCECCKPSILVKGNIVYVMFRNWLNGNRDLYLVQSKDGGKTFGTATKLGVGSWALKGCPMDGGGITVQDNNKVQTVWRREAKIYTSEPGKPEEEIGEGRGCTLTSVNNQTVYAWTENGEVVCLLPKAGKKILGKGRYPVIQAIGNDKVMCVWENERQIFFQVVEL